MNNFKRSFTWLRLLLLLLCSGTVEAQVQPMFMGGSSHSGRFDSSEIKKPVVKWKFRTDGQVFSSPVVCGGTLYIGSNDNTLYALSSTDGQLKWKYAARKKIKSTPAVGNGLVCFHCWDSCFYALDAESGQEKWRFRTRGESAFGAKKLFGTKTGDALAYDPWDFYASSALIKQGRVYFGSGDSSIYCLDAQTGKRLWSYTTQGIVHSSPALADGILYCGSWDSRLYALDAQTGRLLWSYQTGLDPERMLMTGIQASPSLASGCVYIGSRDAGLYALDAQTGKLIWKTMDPGGSWMPSSVAIKGKYLYTGSSDAMKFYVFDRSNGQMASYYCTGFYTFSTPALSGTTAYIGSTNGRLYAIDTNDGHLKWEFTTAAARASLMFDKEGRLNERAMNDVFETGIAAEMSILMERVFASSGSIASSPFVDKGVVYFASTDGFVYALGEGAETDLEHFRSDDQRLSFSVKARSLHYSMSLAEQVLVKAVEWKDNTYKEVKTLRNEKQGAASYQLKWDPTDSKNKMLDEASYFYQLQIGKRGYYLKIE